MPHFLSRYLQASGEMYKYICGFSFLIFVTCSRSFWKCHCLCLTNMAFCYTLQGFYPHTLCIVNKFLGCGEGRDSRHEGSYLFAGIALETAVFPWRSKDEVTCGDIFTGCCCECYHACAHLSVHVYIGVWSEYFQFWITGMIISIINITITIAIIVNIITIIIFISSSGSRSTI